MKKWDAKRNIEREQIYKHLSPQNKEDMLGQIAFNTFVKGEYFFRQDDLQRQIKDYICNLPEATADPEALRLDSEVVLKAIEHHHGLLVERARNIYSFSHLTFQEYFTAREIERERQLEILVQNITDPRWKEVFYLTAEMLRRSDDFLRMMKKRVDKILLQDNKLQSFLDWANKKTNSVQFKCKNAAVRAFYCGLYERMDDDIFLITCAIELNSNFYCDLERDLELDHDLSVIFDFSAAISKDIDEKDHDFTRARIRTLTRDIEYSLNLSDEVLRQSLQPLKDRLPDNQNKFNQWGEDNKIDWKNELRQVCIDRRNIGHDWQFTKEQLELLKQYYAANLLLVECINRSYVSKEVREEIESTLLLPVGVIDS